MKSQPPTPMPNNEAPSTYEAFIKQAEMADPEKFAEVAERYPVLTRHQLRHRTRREIPVSQMKKGARIYFDDVLYAGGENRDSGE